MDVGFIILKRDEDDDTILDYYEHSEYSRDREIFKKFTLEEGSYAVVPITSGALLQKMNQSTKKEKASVNTKKLTAKMVSEKWSEIRHYFASTIFDVFRKIDLCFNGLLSAKELNAFGEMIGGDKKFTTIKQKDFTSEKFKDISCTEEGLTKFGFVQFLFKNYQPDQIRSMLEKLGYDEELNSLKSRVFIVTFQSEEEITVKINDILEGNMYKTAINLFMNHLMDEGEAEIDESKNEDIHILKYFDANSKGYFFGAINKAEER